MDRPLDEGSPRFCRVPNSTVPAPAYRIADLSLGARWRYFPNYFPCDRDSEFLRKGNRMPNHLSSFVVCLASALFAFHPRPSAAEDNCVRDSALAFRSTFHEELETIDTPRFMQNFCQGLEAHLASPSSAQEPPLIQVGVEEKSVEKSVLKACAQRDEKYFENRLRKLAWTLLPKDQALEILAACRSAGDAPLAVAFVAGDAIQITLLYRPKDTETAQVQAKRWSPPDSVDAANDAKLDTAAIGKQSVEATYLRKPTARGALVFSVDTTRGPAKVSIVGDELLGARISASGTPDEFACFAEMPGKQRVRLNPENAGFRCSPDLVHMGDCTQDFMNGRCLVEYGRDVFVKSGTNRVGFIKDKWDVSPVKGGWHCEKNGLALPPTLKFSQAANVESGGYLTKTYLCAGRLTRTPDLK